MPKVAELKSFEKEKYFEGCMPIEVMAQRGFKTMLFGPMKPVGLEDPKTGKRLMLLSSYVKTMLQLLYTTSWASKLT